MADTKPTINSYNLLGGVNQKSSEYSVDKAFFLDLRNVDFDVPNALQKRPGSTQAVSIGTSGRINSLFEFEKLTGESYVIAGSDTALFYLASNNYTLLDSGWSSGQPADMLTFVNKLWVADGQNFKYWNGVTSSGSTMILSGMPCPGGAAITGGGEGQTSLAGATIWTIAGITHAPSSSVALALIATYGYMRNDGARGPINLPSFARNLTNLPAATNGQGITQFHIASISQPPDGYGISGVAIYLSLLRATSVFDNPILRPPKTDTGGSSFVFSNALQANADVANSFYFYTLTTYSASIGIEMAGWSVFAAAASIVPIDTFCAWGTKNASMVVGRSLVPKYIDVNQNVMFMAGFSGAPSTVWFSEIGQPEVVEPEYNFEVRTNDGDKIYANKSFQGVELVMKEKSFHKIIGDNPDNFQLVELSSQYGCISNKSVVEYQEKIAWLDRQGILEFNGSSWNIISTPVEDIFRRMNLSAAKEKACAAHWASRNQVWFGIPIDNSTENNITVVYDYLAGSWTFFDGFNASSFAMIKASGTQPSMWRGNNSGMIYYHSASFYGDNGSGITCLGFSPFDKAKENETWLWRRFFLDVAPASGLTGSINIQLFKNYNRSTIQETRVIYQDQFQSRAEFGVDGKACAAQFSHFSASLPLLINGYSWAKRYLRNV